MRPCKLDIMVSTDDMDSLGPRAALGLTLMKFSKNIPISATEMLDLLYTIWNYISVCEKLHSGFISERNLANEIFY